MTKENYLFEGTREKAVRKAQAVVDFIVPCKVKVYCEWCEDTNRWYMVGAYQQHMNIELGEKKTKTIASHTCYKREKMDRYYDADLFAHFFKQRAAYMNASIEEQIAFEGHPATYGMVSDSFAKVI